VNAWLNRLAPDFTLPAVQGGRVALSDLRGFIVVINFWSADCTWSRRADVLLVYRALTWEPKGVRVLGIASNADETEFQVRHEIENRRVRYPVAFDYSQRVADLYKAEMTPHFFVLDRNGVTRYVGALDDATQQAREAHSLYLDQAVTALLDGRQPDPAATPAHGCAIVRTTSGGTQWPART
jgi:peroxiredoxin